MKKHKLLAIVLTASLAIILGNRASAQVATKVKFYTYPVSLPDVTQIDFGTARDNLMSQLEDARITSTQSRVGRPTGLEIRTVFETGDMTVSTNSIWRSIFNPPGYTNVTGQRIYCPWIVVGEDGQVALHQFEYTILSDMISLLNNSSSLNGLDYSVSRRGVKKGSDGILFTPDDIVIKSGAGSQLVDAVVFIGGRVGAFVVNPGDIDYIDGQITPAGMHITFENRYVSPSGTKSSRSMVMVYPQDGIPNYTNTFQHFPTPVGWLFSVVGPAGSVPFELKSSRNVTGPWMLVNAAATEGSSAFVEYIGDSGTNKAFASKNDQPVITTSFAAPRKLAVLKGGVIMANPSSDLDQDR